MKNNQKNKTAEKEEKGNSLFYQYKVNNYCLDAAKYISNETQSSLPAASPFGGLRFTQINLKLIAMQVNCHFFLIK